MERRLGTFHARREIFERNGCAAPAEDGVQLENAIELVHGFAFCGAMCTEFDDSGNERLNYAATESRVPDLTGR